MSNNISIQALKGNVLTNISINDIIKNMNNDKSETHDISEIIDLQKKNEKRKIKLSNYKKEHYVLLLVKGFLKFGVSNDAELL